MSTIHDLKREANDEFADWREDNPDATLEAWDAAAREIASQAVPVMTTNLFQLVVDDNFLAFCDYEGLDTEPFSILFDVVRREILDSLPYYEESDDDGD